MLFKTKPTVEEMAHNYSVYLRTKTIGMLIVNIIVWTAAFNHFDNN